MEVKHDQLSLNTLQQVFLHKMVLIESLRGVSKYVTWAPSGALMYVAIRVTKEVISTLPVLVAMLRQCLTIEMTGASLFL
jgi:hypothetical protein